MIGQILKLFQISSEIFYFRSIELEDQEWKSTNIANFQTSQPPIIISHFWTCGESVQQDLDPIKKIVSQHWFD